MALEQLMGGPSTVKVLVDGFEKGYWTLEDLDQPPPGHISREAETSPWKRPEQSWPMYRCKRPYRNLLREHFEWLAAHNQPLPVYNSRRAEGAMRQFDR